MGLKRGYIVEEDTPTSAGKANIRRYRLSNGDHVYLPLNVASVLVSRHSPAEELFFLEKGLLGRTTWMGNLHDVRVALSGGVLSPGDVGRLQLPAQETPPGWAPMAEEDDHSMVGAKADDLAETLRQHGTSETADTLTVSSWTANARKEGWCTAQRSDREHGVVVCSREEAVSHSGPHVPTCPTCHNVKVVMFWTSKQAGAWG